MALQNQIEQDSDDLFHVVWSHLDVHLPTLEAASLAGAATAAYRAMHETAEKANERILPLTQDEAEAVRQAIAHAVRGALGIVSWERQTHGRRA
jgi:hypothetical protein